jgi:dolichol-phosphate mannosyltransferase
MRSAIIQPLPASLDLSLVIPVRNESENIRVLASEITDTMSRTPWVWECLWIDDGSTDETPVELTRLHHADFRHHFIQLESGRGQSAALAVGLSNARGRLLVTLDGDGQNDPADIPRLVELLEANGADMVNGWREKRRNNIVRRISSRIANGFRNRLTHESVRDVGCSLRVFRREAVAGVVVFNGMHRFFPTLVRLNGYDRFLEVPVNDRPRRRGQTKYGINNRLWVGLVDTLAVRWMMRRNVAPRVKMTSMLSSTVPQPGSTAAEDTASLKREVSK